MSAGETSVTGCVRTQRADAGAADAKGNIYTLELTSGSGREGAMAGTATAGGTGTATAAGTGTATAGGTGTATAGAKGASMTAKTMYTIAAPESVAIGKHVGHQVELTGRLQPAMGSGAAAGAAAATSAKPEPGGAHRTFQVTALKMISAKCP